MSLAQVTVWPDFAAVTAPISITQKLSILQNLQTYCQEIEGTGGKMTMRLIN